MRRRLVAATGCGVGLVGGFALALLIGAGERSYNEGRYQLHVWSTPGVGYNGNGGVDPTHGAYRIDTQTGEVYSINANDGMHKVGS